MSRICYHIIGNYSLEKGKVYRELHIPHVSYSVTDHDSHFIVHFHGACEGCSNLVYDPRQQNV